jgi:hypothetical protein
MTLTPPPHRHQANNPAPEDNRIIPEQMSLSACKHIKAYMGDRTELNKNELNAVLRLSQHLRVFGLLSATGYVNQENAQQGEVRQRTVPVWSSLLGQLIDEDNPPNRRQLMERVKDMAKDRPTEYMMNWRRSLILANHWNFWAKAYAGDE